MIRGIRRRFVRIAIAVLAVAMVLVTVIINAANWMNVRAEMYETMSYLTEDGVKRGGHKGGWSRHMRNTVDESLFFSAAMNEDGSCALLDTSRLTEADDGELLRIAERALSGGRETGFSGDYLYVANETRIGRFGLFLNCETKLTRVRRLALISALACAGCILLAWLLVALLGSRAIRPMAESIAQQKQFITDAGHELKTPLTVISANMDVLALETGEDNEWIRSTRKQVANLRGLVGELIYLSRMDEEDAKLAREDVDLSRLVEETAEPFVGMAEFSGKALEMDVEPGVHVTGDAAALARLTSILCDNAVKYAPEGDAIALTLRRGRRGVELACENGVTTPLSEETLRHLFDRFYRADASRSRDSGGYGIGLSVALAIAEKHGGDIRVAQTEAGRLRFVCRIKN